MHTFGHPVELDELQVICDAWGITLVEDVAESLGSFYKGRHTGTIGRFSAMSFNGNKVITTGGEVPFFRSLIRMVRVKHLTTTAEFLIRMSSSMMRLSLTIGSPTSTQHLGALRCRL